MLIGLNGKAKSGKDTTFGFIREWAEEQGHPVRRDAFADRLKLSAARALGFCGQLEEAIAFCNDLKESQCVGYGASGMDVFITGREYLQYYGTEAHRDVFGNDFWIAAVLDGYSPFDSSELLVITDVRFPNEAVAVRGAGGHVWEISRPGHTIAETDHPSEQELPAELIEAVLVNAGDLADLRAMTRSSLERAVSV